MDKEVIELQEELTVYFQENHEVIALLNELVTHDNSEAYEKRLQLLRTWAGECRTNQSVRVVMERLISLPVCKIPEESQALFRAFYFDGRMTARQIAEQYAMDVSTVYKKNREVLLVLMPVVYGVDGIRWGGGGDV